MKRSLCRILGAILAISICLPLMATRVVAEETGDGTAVELSQQGPASNPSEPDSPEDAPDLEPPEPSEMDSPSEEGQVVPADDQEDVAQEADPESSLGIPLLVPTDRGPADVYVNGSTGDDGNPGTEAEPVKTFEKAKELLEVSGGDTIYVTGAITLSGVTGTWDLDGKTLARGDGYHGELVRLSSGAILTLGNIVLDGRSGDGATGVVTGSDGGGGSLVGVYGGSALTVGEGSVLQNNHIESRGVWYPEGGGAIFANRSTVNVESGTIRNNEAVLGGGIYGIYDSVINMSSGTITGNRAIRGNSSTLPESYGGCGGGICAANGTDANLSGGTISGNSAFERGGGISMGTYYASEWDSPVLTMTGGTISDNTAGSSGGGIFVQAGYSESGNGGTPTYSIASITAGDITGNSVTATGEGSPMFGGGGIYVNGYSSMYAAFHNGELYLANVEISGNSAVIEGGGYAACPVSVTEISLTNGAAFYGNTTDEGNARELYILAASYLGSHSGDPVYEISPSMLGGGAYKWVYDDGTEVPLDDLKGVLSALYNQTLSLSNDLAADDPAVQRALGLIKVRITGNTSVTRGGGIGSNGSVFIGKSVETTEITVSKTWSGADEPDGTRPTSIKVNLYRDDEYVGYQIMEPDDDGDWSMTFANLPKNDANGHEYTYTVEERVPEGYLAVVEGSAAEGYAIINTPSTSVSVTKAWVGPVGDPVTVHLFADGVDTERMIVLSADTSWAGSFDGLRKYDAVTGGEIAYTVSEDPVLHYSATISGNAADGFTITNTNSETVDISGTKTWADGNDRDGIRPPSITINLLADGIEIAEKTVTAADGWSYSFTGLDKYDPSDGHEIAYAVMEDPVLGYTSTVKGYDITNTHQPAIPSTGDSSLTGLILPVIIAAGLMAISVGLRSARRGLDLRG